MRIDEQQIATSVLVIGTGGGGLRAAIGLAERGVDVLALGKRSRGDAHTSLAAGGINAALATMDPEDTWQQHAADTLQKSYLLANPDLKRPRWPLGQRSTRLWYDGSRAGATTDQTTPSSTSRCGSTSSGRARGRSNGKRSRRSRKSSAR